MNLMDQVTSGLKRRDIGYRHEGESLKVALPDAFGDLEVRAMEEGGSIVGLVGEDWHTHGDLLTSYGPSDEAEAIVAFIEGIFEGRFFLVAEQGTGEGTIKTIEDDLEAYIDSLPAEASYR